MKRISGLLLVLVLCGSLSACGDKSDEKMERSKQESVQAGAPAGAGKQKTNAGKNGQANSIDVPDSIAPENALEPESSPDAENSVLLRAKEYIGSEASALEEAIGSPSSKSYSPSCMGEGEDGIWTYDHFIAYTYRGNGTETVEAVQ